jgi:hypothetical protein
MKKKKSKNEVTKRFEALLMKMYLGSEDFGDLRSRIGNWSDSYTKKLLTYVITGKDFPGENE